MRGWLKSLTSQCLMDQLIREERLARERRPPHEVDEDTLSLNQNSTTPMSEADKRSYRRLVSLFSLDHRGISAEDLDLFNPEEQDRLESMAIRMRWERLWLKTHVRRTVCSKPPLSREAG